MRGGAAGGTAIEVIPFPSGTNVPVTIGTGGPCSTWTYVQALEELEELHHLVLIVQLLEEQVDWEVLDSAS
jgi:hypothetical protein